MPIGAHAQDRGPTKEEIIEAQYSGPVFLDAFWTSGSSQNGTEIDVGPGDGASTLAVVLINRGPSDIAGITGRLTIPGDFKATGKGAGAVAEATFNQVAPVGSTFVLLFDVDVLDTAKVGEYTARLQVDYSRIFESGTPRTVEMNVPFRVTGEAILTVSRASSSGQSANSTQISAGKIEDFAFSISNTGTTPITNVVVTLESPSESLKILGDAKWDIQTVSVDSKVDLATKVFAADSLIGNPASFSVTVEYSSNGEPNLEKFTLGTYVAGEISIRAYDIEVTYIGGIPNIVGNLLNEGNTVALFTSIEIVGAGNLVADLPPAQYLGDLEENSPLPFSIPVQVASNSSAGTYPISLKISYKDDLRELHTIDINSGVQFAPEQPDDESGQDNSMMMTLPIVIGAMAVAGIGAAVAVKRRKKAALRRTIQAGKQDDIESFLDTHNKKDGRK